MIYALVLLLLDTTVAHACKVCMISYVFRNVRLNMIILLVVWKIIVLTMSPQCSAVLSPRRSHSGMLRSEVRSQSQAETTSSEQKHGKLSSTDC